MAKGLGNEEAVAVQLLASLGVEDYEPAVLGMVLEQMHRTVQVVLSDSRDLALHAGASPLAFS